MVSSLGKGGAERSGALLTTLLADLGHDIYVVSVLNDIDYEYSGTLLNLGVLKDANDSIIGRIKRFLYFKRFLRTHRFDYIIDNRSRPTSFKEVLISKYLYHRMKHIYVVRSNNLSIYLGPNRTLTKWIYKKADRIVAVSDETKRHIEDEYGFDNVVAIHNPVDVKRSNESTSVSQSSDDKYILFYGRIDDAVKNISLLIDGYEASKLRDEDIQLVILGDGKDKETLEAKVSERNLVEQVIFKPFTNDPFSLIENALFTVLTSRFEGFPRALIESLAMGTPVISVDCSSGPKEIISHEQNGLLIENNDVKVLAEAMNNFIFDEALYARCKGNAKNSVKKFSMKNIALKWQEQLV